MQNPPTDLTRLIEPTENHLVLRLSHSLELQATVLKEVQQQLLSGKSACQLDALERLHRLHEVHDLLMRLYQRISLVGSALVDLQKHDPDGHAESDDVPF